MANDESVKENVRVIDSGISVKHAKTWTTGEAVREVVQNYLDVRSEFQLCQRNQENLTA